MSIGPNVVFNCPCGHKPPPFGTNDTCQPVVGQTCGGIANQCPICYANQPPVATIPQGEVTSPPFSPPNLPPSPPPNVAGEWHGIPIEADEEADSGRKTESGE